MSFLHTQTHTKRQTDEQTEHGDRQTEQKACKHYILAHALRDDEYLLLFPQLEARMLIVSDLVWKR